MTPLSVPEILRLPLNSAQFATLASLIEEHGPLASHLRTGYGMTTVTCGGRTFRLGNLMEAGGRVPVEEVPDLDPRLLGHVLSELADVGRREGGLTREIVEEEMRSSGFAENQIEQVWARVS